LLSFSLSALNGWPNLTTLPPTGPFHIVRVLPHNNVKIRLSARRKSIFHANNLKTYHLKGEFQKSLEKKRKKVKAQKNFHHPKEGGEDQEKQTNKLTRKHFQHSKTSMNATC
jgi:hypothetical protein